MRRHQALFGEPAGNQVGVIAAIEASRADTACTFADRAQARISW
jgi:hypothetical protein